MKAEERIECGSEANALCGVPQTRAEAVPCKGAAIAFVVIAFLLLPAVPYLCHDNTELRIDRAFALAGAVMAVVSGASIRYEGLSLGKIIAIAYGVLTILFSLSVDVLFTALGQIPWSVPG